MMGHSKGRGRGFNGFTMHGRSPGDSNNQMPVCQTAYFGLVKPPAEETRCPSSARTFIAMYPNEGVRQVQVFITSFIFSSWKTTAD